MMKKFGSPVSIQTTPTYHVFYHANCQDGYHSAVVFLKWYHEEAEHKYPYVLHAAQYGDTFPEADLKEGDKVFILDFSWPSSVLDPLAEKYDLIVLDHHDTSEKDLRGKPYATFDMNKSGASLSWDYFFPEQPRPLYVTLTEDGDLWKFKNSITKPYREFFRVYLKGTPIEDGLEFLSKDGWEEEMQVKAQVCLDVLGNIVSKVPYRVRKGKLGNIDTLFVESTEYASEIAEALYTKHKDKVACVWCYDSSKHKIILSLRAHKDSGLRVNDLAATFGGGGHVLAAGCTMLVRDFEHQLNMGDKFEF